jgi:two-component SAPR family response regulator
VKLVYCKVLIVEDDYFQAADYRDLLTEAHCLVLGPVSTEQEALDLLVHEVPDIAILDLNLGSGTSFALARFIRAQDIPVCFATGYDCSSIPEEFSDIPCINKPVKTSEVLLALEAARG